MPEDAAETPIPSAPRTEPESDAPASAHDLRTIRQLVRLMARFDLVAIDLGEGPGKIRLRRRGSEPAPASYAPAPAGSSMPMYSQPHAAPAPAATTAPAPAATTAPASKAVHIESPMVGTYYSASSPDQPPFVSVGTTVRADTTVCVIEAMKVFTDIPAGLGGVIAEVLVKNGQPVEFGQPLFRIEPA
jgi:acetyl-CoA carboxylase biotin carboxyl carrier protein